MSRHRMVRNLNLDDGNFLKQFGNSLIFLISEMDDDYDDYDDYEDEEEEESKF